MEINIRKGTTEDLPVVLGILDSAVAWLNGKGITAQWGTEPFSARPAAVEQVQHTMAEGDLWIAEANGVPAGTMTLTPHPGKHVPPAPEPEVYIRLLATEARFHHHRIGAALLAHATTETRRQKISLLRVDCFAGSEGRLVAYYEKQGFTRTDTFAVGDWQGQILERRV
ncbi:GNAT family N-acetyltransferase [Streptomyces sp. NPDC090109]|uniref:GNAT family N-acetyltransferase n=1 Tax=Streptomyces sp. NPDC090109 TaxID=3365948 RepID=UPI00381637EA